MNIGTALQKRKRHLCVDMEFMWSSSTIYAITKTIICPSGNPFVCSPIPVDNPWSRIAYEQKSCKSHRLSGLLVFKLSIIGSTSEFRSLLRFNKLMREAGPVIRYKRKTRRLSLIWWKHLMITSNLMSPFSNTYSAAWIIQNYVPLPRHAFYQIKNNNWFNSFFNLV